MTMVAIALAAALQPGALPQDLTDLSLEELAGLEVTTASRKPEPLLQAPSALDVVTGEDVHRSGADRLTEALRLSPGVVAAQIDSWRWSVGVRGFASVLSRNLLVQMDGRNLYTPLFAGVHWEAQDTFLPDLDRIEVNRGPVGSLFGANAMNGVVSIFTLPARRTQGLVVLGTLGNEMRRASVRYGDVLGEDTHYRVYAKYQDHEAGFAPGGDAMDDWDMSQAGFRLDSGDPGRTSFTLQGDAYTGAAGQRAGLSFYTPPYQRTLEGDADLSGANLMARGSTPLAGGTARATAYWDRTRRRELLFEELRNTWSLDAAHQVVLGGHEVGWGFEARRSHGTLDSGAETITVLPRTRDDDTVALFARDELRFAEGRVRVSAGSRLEWNDYTGWNVQPAARVAWTDGTRHTVWASVGRAVRALSRAEHDATLTASLDPARPLFARALPEPDFRPETVVAVEAGHRRRWSPRLLTDVSLFHSTYRELAGRLAGDPFVEPPGRVIVPLTLANLHQAESWGGEARAVADLRPSWRVEAWYAHLRLDLDTDARAADAASATVTEGSAPRHMAGLVSSLTIARRVEVDGVLRHVSALPGQGVDARTTLDARVAVRGVGPAEIALVGRNLLRPHHAEWAAGSIEVERSIRGSVILRF